MEVREASAAYAVTAKPQVPKGYKQTEVGAIPEDWDVAIIADVADKITVGFVGSMAHLFTDNGIPLLRGQNVLQNKLDLTEMRFISAETHKRWKKSALQEGDMVMVRVGYPGTSCVISEELGDANAASLVVVRPARKKLSAHYLSLVINSDFGRRQIESYLVGGAQQVLNTKTAAIFKLPLPTKAEQEAIAEALSDADALIDSLERLLAKKRHLKQGAMQELLTGKKRLPGFGGEWRACQLGDVINHCSSGATPYRGRPEYYKGTVKWITSGELNYNVITDTIEHISVEAVQLTNLKTHPTGTFLMAITGLEAAGTRGACGIVGSPATTNQSCMAIYPSPELKAEFLYHYYVLRGSDLALQYCQGTKQQSYTAKLVRLLPIDLPPSVAEQTAIADILSDMDADLAALEAKLVKTRILKQAMMQELLTGRIRLVKPGLKAANAGC